MDRKLARHLPDRPGTFVEAGAFDGFEQSNTYYLERFRGWRGVLVEPVPELFALAARERPDSQVFNCALVAPEDEGRPVEMHFGGLVSVVKGAWPDPDADRAHAETGSMGGWSDVYDLSSPGRTLSAVLDEAGVGEIDLMSLDVEGFEVPVLRGLDLDCHAPALLLVEMREMATMRPGVEAVLGERYAAVEPLSPFDLLYRRTD
jgi:FkbM family methyltransferase